MRRWIMSKNIIIVLIYHRHKPLDHINLSDLFSSFRVETCMLGGRQEGRQTDKQNLLTYWDSMHFVQWMHNKTQLQYLFVVYLTKLSVAQRTFNQMNSWQWRMHEKVCGSTWNQNLNLEFIKRGMNLGNSTIQSRTFLFLSAA
jgi:hypothetical protein